MHRRADSHGGRCPPYVLRRRIVRLRGMLLPCRPMTPPLDRPAFIMLVKIDQPKDDPLGGIVAAPVFGKLAPQILSYLNATPDNLPAGTPLVRKNP